MKDPMKSRDVVPKSVPGVGWGEDRHKSTEYHKNFAYMITTNNYRIVDFLTLIYMEITLQCDPVKHRFVAKL